MVKDTKVSFLRPIRPSVGYVFTWDIIHLTRPFLNWLKYESDVAEGSQYLIDADLDNYSEFSSSEVLVVPAHNEYWTLKAKRNFDKFIDSGKDGIVLGGNIMWWHARYENRGTELVVMRSMNDPGAKKGEETFYLSSLGSPAYNSIGGIFTYGGYDDNQWDGVKGQKNPMRIVRPNGVLFQGTGLKKCDDLDLSYNHEMDGPPISGFDFNGLPKIITTAYQNLYNMEILAYTWGYRGGHTVGTIHAYQPKAESGTVLQYASNGAAAFAFTNSTAKYYKRSLQNAFEIMIKGKYTFESESLYDEPLKTAMTFPYKGQKIPGIEVCPK